MIEDGMLLYHGSYAAITKIDLNRCSSGKDFGKGFYLTSDRQQAANFINTSLKKAKSLSLVSDGQDWGFVSVFRYHRAGKPVPIYEFETADRMWLWFVSVNRRSQLAGKLSDKLDAGLLDAEVIIGKIANDTTNPTILAYLNGLYGDVESEEAVEFAVRQLMPDRLRLQYCFLTERAVACLEPLEVIRVER